MKQKKCDIAYLAFAGIATLFFILAFQTFNNQHSVNLPDVKESFSEWGVNSCDIGKDYIYVSGWSAPKYSIKLKTIVFAQDSQSGEYYQLKTMVYPRSPGTKEMRDNGFFDNSGFVSAIRLPTSKLDSFKNIAILSQDKDGNWLRGDYACK
ncbi:hypothetical protein B9D02_05405 [Pantoea vagans]|nr:hypothetical protein [Pantoea vagans]AWP32048.1 hypothetical protein B9D02_05405 [Pantoea vagans]